MNEALDKFLTDLGEHKKPENIIASEEVSRVAEEAIATIRGLVESDKTQQVANEAIKAIQLVSSQDNTSIVADKAIEAMRQIAGNNEQVMGQVVQKLSIKPLRFDIGRDKDGNMTSVIPVYERSNG